jgi:hypothetical protein
MLVRWSLCLTVTMGAGSLIFLGTGNQLVLVFKGVLT